MFGDKPKSKDIVPGTAEPSQFMQMIEKIANNPKIDADTVEKFLDMQERILDRDAKTAFFGAMNQVQAQIKPVMPDARNEQTHSDYARLQAIAAAIKPIYTAEGFSVSFWQGEAKTEGFIRIEGVLRHRDGHSEPYWVELPPDKAGIRDGVNKTDVHAAASTFTYGRRYLTCMIFDVAVGFDADGNVPVEAITEEQVANIESLITEVSANRARLLKWKGADSIEAILASDYRDVIAELESRR